MAKDILPGGLADNKPDSDFDQKALKEGVKVELEHTDDPQVAKEVSKDHLEEFPEYYSALKVMEQKLKDRKFKKSSLLQKGAMRRLAPWTKESRQATANLQEDLGDWQENANRTSRKNLTHQKIDDSSRKRTLHKLSGMTPTKVHPDGKRSFLLHRGMDIGEYRRAKTKGPKGPAFQHHEESSWTPNLTISGGFASDAGRDLDTPEGAHVSAWIHEDQIALMPNQHSQNTESAQYKYEQEVIVKPRGVSPLVRRDEVTKLTGVDKDDKYSHPGGKVLDNPDRMINFRQQNQKQFGGDPVARNKYILPEFNRNRFKKSQLQKGVKQRLFPVKGGVEDTKNPDEANFQMESWQTHVNSLSRNRLASDAELKPSPNAMARALHTLHGKTAVRRGKNGEREFLLHRGIGPKERDEAIDLPSRITMHASPVSWTPNIEIAGSFESLESARHGGKSGGIISAWIPESAIAHIPKQLGRTSRDNTKLPNRYASEHEVIVHPGEYNLVHDKEVKRLIGQGKRDLRPGIYSLDQAINFRANPDVDRKDVTETYAEQRRQFKKSQLLAKAPIIHEQDNDFTYKTLDDNAFNEHFHEMVHEESLSNGLIHHIYQEKNSPDGIIHSLSEGDPSQPVSLIAGYIEHKGPYKGYNAHLTATSPEHQGQGHGTLLKELATKRHGRMVSDATLSPAEDRSWQKLKRPDIDVKFGQKFEGDIEEHPDDANEAAQDAHIATYKKPLAASEFKKSSLIKGAARRLYGKFDPVKELAGDSKMKNWVSGNSGEDAGIQGIRSKLPEPSAGAKLRMTNKLANRAKSRLNPETKQREFLLHRQMSQWEFENSVQGNRINHTNPKAHTSWTPNLNSITESSGIYPRSTFDSTDNKSYNTVVSAWIPESHIKTMPIQYGEAGTYDESSYGTPTSTALKEQEVIVHPGHNSEIHDVLQDTGQDKSKWNWSKKFQKSSIFSK